MQVQSQSSGGSFVRKVVVKNSPEKTFDGVCRSSYSIQILSTTASGRFWGNIFLHLVSKSWTFYCVGRKKGRADPKLKSAI